VTRCARDRQSADQHHAAGTARPYPKRRGMTACLNSCGQRQRRVLVTTADGPVVRWARRHARGRRDGTVCRTNDEHGRNARASPRSPRIGAYSWSRRLWNSAWLPCGLRPLQAHDPVEAIRLRATGSRSSAPDASSPRLRPPLPRSISMGVRRRWTGPSKGRAESQAPNSMRSGFDYRADDVFRLQRRV
jgi:hypothetical protein